MTASHTFLEFRLVIAAEARPADMVIVIYFIMVTQQSKNCSPRPFFEIFQLTAKFNAFQLRSLLQQHVVSK